MYSFCDLILSVSKRVPDSVPLPLFQLFTVSISKRVASKSPASSVRSSKRPTFIRPLDSGEHKHSEALPYVARVTSRRELDAFTFAPRVDCYETASTCDISRSFFYSKRRQRENSNFCPSGRKYFVVLRSYRVVLYF